MVAEWNIQSFLPLIENEFNDREFLLIFLSLIANNQIAHQVIEFTVESTYYLNKQINLEWK